MKWLQNSIVFKGSSYLFFSIAFRSSPQIWIFIMSVVVYFPLIARPNVFMITMYRNFDIMVDAEIVQLHGFCDY